MATDQEFALLCSVVQEQLGISLHNYRSRQLDRRLAFFLLKNRLASITELVGALRRDKELCRQFSDFLTINVSEFYRNPDRFTVLQNKYLPALLRQREKLRIWSAGCSIGAEIYTIALILAHLTPGRQHTLLATDIDRASLNRCQAGTYQASELRQVPSTTLRRFFTISGDTYTLSPAIRKQVVFRLHDLLKDPFPGDQDLIICRNVVIYFTSEAKAELYRRFHAALRPGGILFIGSTESIFNARDIGLRYLEPCFYERPV